MSKPSEPEHGPTSKDAGLTSGSTRAKRLRGEDEDRGEATLQDMEQVERVVPPRPDSERGTPEAAAETYISARLRFMHA